MIEKKTPIPAPLAKRGRVQKTPHTKKNKQTNGPNGKRKIKQAVTCKYSILKVDISF